MSNRFVEGFATYGQATNFGLSSAVAQAMLAGRWAYFINDITTYSIGQLPWAATDPDLFFSGFTGSGGNQGPRFVVPGGPFAEVIVSLYAALTVLPPTIPDVICTICDNSNNPAFQICVTPSGQISVVNASNTQLAISASPVITAQNAVHLEFSASQSGGTSSTIIIQVNGVQVVDATGLTFSTTSNLGQVRLFDTVMAGAGPIGNGRVYIGNLIVRDSGGAVNNAIIGDRRVSTVFPVSNNGAVQGWLARPLQRFGAGVLDLSPTDAAVAQNAALSALDIGANAFTIEGQFRFDFLPSISNEVVLFSIWDAANNHRECELLLSGPNNLEWIISTDGTSGTVTTIAHWQVALATGVWYSIAVCRDSSNKTRLFLNGNQIGAPAADANTYFAAGAAGARACLGAEYSGGVVAGTPFGGQIDEFRYTLGIGRYTTTFSPPVAAFPRGGGDADWAYVEWISGFDSGTIVDESSFARTLVALNSAAAIIPADGTAAWQVINKPTPSDETFVEAPLYPASNALNCNALPTNSTTVTLGTTDGTTPAVYTWTNAAPTVAFQVYLGATPTIAMTNLAAAIAAGAGSGTQFGAGTTANHDVSGAEIGAALLAVALTPGAAGNSIVSTTTDTNSAWDSATLAGGVGMVGASQFGYGNLPSNVVEVDSVTFLTRQWKTDSATAQTKVSFFVDGASLDGTENSLTTTPTVYTDTFEAVPGTSGFPLSAAAVSSGFVQLNRLT